MAATCGKCGLENDRTGQRYCRPCHNAYMRANRPAYSQLSPEQKKRDSARSHANTYQARGKLRKEPCKACGSNDHVEKHHNDYSKPLDVVWLCRPCHKGLHAQAA